MLGVPLDLARVEYEAVRNSRLRLDALYESGSYAFVIESKSSSVLGQVVRAVDFLKSALAELPPTYIPLLAVPYMSRSGQAYCERAHVGWLDLSGNARIVAPGLFVNSVGHRNRFQRPGRVESAFGPRGSRVARSLLLNPSATVRQRVLARETGLNEAYVSRVVRRLIEMDLVARDAEGVRVRDADKLLDAWHDEYRFWRHNVTRGHITPPTGEAIVEVIDRVLSGSETSYAATGLTAAWSYTEFAGFRLSTVYLDGEPPDRFLREIGFREERRGANTWLVSPIDIGVFDGAKHVGGIRCVHPVQAYLDLKVHPERSSEAAGEIRRQLLKW